MNKQKEITIMLVTLLAASVLMGCASAPSTVPPDRQARTLDGVHKGLSAGPLRYARLSKLPAGTLLRAGKLIVTEKQLSVQLGKAPVASQPMLKKNKLFMLEQMAARPLLLSEAAAWAKARKSELAGAEENALLQGYLQDVASKVTVSDAEKRDYYEKNKEACGGATYETVAASLEQMLRSEKQQAAVDEHIQTLGKRTAIEVDAKWCKAQAQVMLVNPVDKARSSGGPALVDFGSKGCKPCDMLAPILEELRKAYAGKCQVIFIDVRQEQVLGARYGARTIPVQVFFDARGNEVFRHVGFWPKDDLVKQLGLMGVK